MPEICKLPTESLPPPTVTRHSTSKSPHAPRDDAKLAVRRIRHNPTQCNTVRQQATETRARTRERGNGVPFLPLDTECAQLAAVSWMHSPKAIARVLMDLPRSQRILGVAVPPWLTYNKSAEPRSQRILGVAVPEPSCQ